MHRQLVKRLGMSVAPLLLLAGTAAVAEGVDVNITNDGTEDIVVTVYDMSIGPNAVVLSHTRINGFTTIPISVSLDETGHANLAWTAVSADSSSRKCGHQDAVTLGDSASLTVRADSDCSVSS